MVETKKHNIMVYMKYGHVNSKCSELAAGTGRPPRLAARDVSCPLPVVAMLFS
jgi:hypothetical protein